MARFRLENSLGGSFVLVCPLHFHRPSIQVPLFNYVLVLAQSSSCSSSPKLLLGSTLCPRLLTNRGHGSVDSRAGVAAWWSAELVVVIFAVDIRSNSCWIDLLSVVVLVQASA